MRRKHKNVIKRTLAMLLILAMVLGLLPSPTVFAEEMPAQSTQAEESTPPAYDAPETEETQENETDPEEGAAAESEASTEGEAPEGTEESTETEAPDETEASAEETSEESVAESTEERSPEETVASKEGEEPAETEESTEAETLTETEASVEETSEESVEETTEESIPEETEASGEAEESTEVEDPAETEESTETEEPTVSEDAAETTESEQHETSAEEEDNTPALIQSSGRKNISLRGANRSADDNITVDIGYEPSAYTNDSSMPAMPIYGSDPAEPMAEQTQSFALTAGETVTLGTPQRFGYTFAGWTESVNGGTGTAYTDGSRTITEEDITNGTQFGYTAAWTAKRYSAMAIALSGTAVPASDVRIRFGSSDSWKTLAEAQAAHSTVFSLSGAILSINPASQITYGQTLGNYFTDTLGLPGFPELKDNRTDASVVMAFDQFTSATGTAAAADTAFNLESGLFALGAGQTMADLDSSLQNTPVALGDNWTSNPFTVTVTGAPSDWSWSYEIQDAMNNWVTVPLQGSSFDVPRGAIVVMTVPASSTNYVTGWSISYTDASSGNTVYLHPSERPYTTGEQNVNYEWNMPAAAVAASYHDFTSTSNPIYVNIANSPIVFADSVEYHNRTFNGFWFAGEIDGMSPLFTGTADTSDAIPNYDLRSSSGNLGTTGSSVTAAEAGFYPWQTTWRLYVTSENVATTNQIILISNLTMYCRDVNLAPEANYANNTNGHTIAGRNGRTNNTSTGATGLNLSTYGNIILSNDVAEKITVTVTIIGTSNKICAIMQKVTNVLANARNTLYIYGNNSKTPVLELGSVFGNMTTGFWGLTVNERPNDPFTILVQAMASGVSFNYTTLNAKHKDIVCNISTPTSSMSGSNVYIRNMFVYSFSLSKSSYTTDYNYLRVYGSITKSVAFLTASYSSNVVVDGSIIGGSSSYNTITGTNFYNGTLIVKGQVCDLGNCNWNGGNLIANSVYLGYGGTVKGNWVTNQITNRVSNYSTWTIDSEGTVSIIRSSSTSYADETSANGDNLPFATRSAYASPALHVNFSFAAGSNVYLMGYYGIYNGKTAVDAENPLKPIIESLLDENGDLSANASFTTARSSAQSAITAANNPYRSNECIIYGNSLYETGSRSRTIVFSGGNVYAAGNMTLFNKTNVTGGTIWCGGRFGTKRDLTISGGSVTASEVGNAYSVIHTDDDTTKRWMLTEIKGGTVTSNRIGAMSVFGPDAGATPRSTVIIRNANAIVGTPTVAHDEYINYIYDSSVFTNPSANGNNVHFEGTWNASYGTVAGMTWTSMQDVSFRAPYAVGHPSETGGWHYDALTNPAVDSIKNGLPTFENVAVEGLDNAWSVEANTDKVRDRLLLYAAKELYNVILVSDPDGKVQSITYDGDSPDPSTHVFTNNKKSAQAGKTVTLILTDAAYAADYTVLWYLDGSGLYHNVMPTVSGAVITFTMPYADVELYVTKTMTLDLNKFSVSLTADGFWVEFSYTRADSAFHYAGDYVITQVGKTTKRYSAYGEVVYTSPNNSTTGATSKGIRIAADFDNTDSGGRSVTLQNFIQTGVQTTHGFLMESGASALLTVNGNIRFWQGEIPAGAELTLRGTSSATDGIQATRYFISGSNAGTTMAFGCATGPCGNITYENLTICGTAQGPNRMNYSFSKGATVITYRNCYFKAANFYSNNYLAVSCARLIIDHSTFEITADGSWPTPPFSNCDHIEYINGSVVTLSGMGSTNGSYSLVYNNAFAANGDIIIDNSTVTQSLRSVSNDNYTTYVYINRLPQNVIVRNGGVYNFEKRVRLHCLTVEEGGTVNVGGGTGHLLAEKITVTGGTLNAGDIIVAGFYDYKDVSTSSEPQYESNFQADMAQNKRILNGADYDGLVISGGTVNVGGFVGGDVNAKITVSGGTLNAPAIGTSGYLWGFTRKLPKTGDPNIYKYARIPVAATVNVTGGTVNVTEDGYLGGVKATVNVSGGTVNLADGAVIGLTDNQVTALSNHYSLSGDSIAAHAPNVSVNISGGTVEKTGSGSISTAYGEVNISGTETKIHVQDFKAEHGTVSITEAGADLPNKDTDPGVSLTHVEGWFDNPYTVSDRYHRDVAIWVENALSAMDIEITDGAVVYARTAVASVEAGESGGLVVTRENGGAGGDRAYLYTGGSFGTVGAGSIENSYYTAKDEVETPEHKRNVFGQRIIGVNYHLNPDNPHSGRQEILAADVNSIVNPDENPEFYEVSDSGEITLLNASCPGYIFLGWYNSPEMADGQMITKLLKEQAPASGSVDLYARWERVRVPFEVRISGIATSDVDPATMTLVDENTSTYKWNLLSYAEYGGPMLGVNQVNLANYATLENVIAYVNLQDEYYNSGTALPVEGSTYVTLDIVQAYQAKAEANGGDPDTPLILMERSSVKSSVTITFHMNPAGGLPIETRRSFHNDPAAVNQDELTASSPVAVDDVLLNGMGFADADYPTLLMQPVAPGYTFGGWYLDADCTDENRIADNGQVTVAWLQHHGTTLYAKWTPKVYTVQFVTGEVDEKTWIMPGADRPAKYDATNNPGNTALDYLWTYDSVLADGTFRTASAYSYQTVSGGSTQSVTVPAQTVESVLPTAWREGYKFLGWKYTDAEGEEQTVTVEDSADMPALNLSNLALAASDGFPVETPPVFTLTAVWEKASVTYHMTEGSWADGTSADITADTLAYGDPLMAYYAAADLTGTGYNAVADAADADDSSLVFKAKSTTAAYFANNGSYVSGDFRETLKKKGYTFAGWTDGTDLFGGAPRFEDLEVYDSWTANSYTLNLFGKETPAVGYSYTSDFSPAAAGSTGFGTLTDISVTVGEAIASSVWPPRDGVWYAVNPGVDVTTTPTAMRYLLGVTFAAMDPGTSVVDGYSQYESSNLAYTHYAEAITRMYASRTLLDRGDVFFLPEDAGETGYRHDIGSATVVTGAAADFSVPDYPSGSTIKMYGVYRERSLVLIERYVNAQGEEYRAIWQSGPWMKYIDASAYNPVIDGYTFKGWYVNTENLVTSKLYPGTESQYEANRDTYRDEATALGTYDIMVYTVFVPQAKTTLTLNASQDPAHTPDTEAYKIEETYLLPGSLQSGWMGFVRGALPDGFGLVPVGEGAEDGIIDHLVDTGSHTYSWTDVQNNTQSFTATADNAVAITLTVEKADGSDSQTYDLAKYSGSAVTWFDRAQVAIGDKITLRLYHSSVMTTEALHTLSNAETPLLHFSFDNDTDHTTVTSAHGNSLAEQSVDMTVKVQMKPSLYTVTYTAELPEPAEDLGDTLDFSTDNGTFTVDDTVTPNTATLVISRSETDGKVAFGTQNSTAVYPAPAIVGYTFGITAGGSFTEEWSVSAPVVGSNTLTASGGYVPNLYDLTADAGTLDRWTVSYTDHLLSTDDANSPLSTAGTAEQVKYHSTVTFTPNGTQYPEFITLTLGDGSTYRLDDDAFVTDNGDGSYSFRMPATSVTATFEDVMTLYLDNGSFELTADGYRQYDKTLNDGAGGWNEVVWHGDYLILQNAENSTATEATETNPGWTNTLSISGDLSGSTITLGNLKILSDDSISLADGAKANLTVGSTETPGSITAKNILVPGQATELSVVSGMSGSADVALSPAATRAGIGGSTAVPASGTISLINIDLSMTLPSSDHTPSGIGPGSADCTQAGDISLTGCTVTVDIPSQAGVLYKGTWIGGAGVGEVTLDDTDIATTATGATQNPVHAINGQIVNLQKGSSLGSASKPLYDAVHAVNELNIKDSSVYLSNQRDKTMIGTGNSGFINITNSTVQVAQASSTNTAELYTGVMKIFDPASDVTVNGTQILEVSHGAMTLNSNSVTQGSITHSHGELNYLLLEELKPSELPSGNDRPYDITVSSLGEGKTVTVREPHAASGNTAVTVDDLTVDTDTQIILNGDLTVMGTTSVKSGKTMTVTTDTVNGSTLTLTDGFADTTGYYGSFAQTGGALISTGGSNLAVGGDMTLTDVAANAGTGNLGSTGKGAAVTTVALENSTVTAAVTGALGPQDIVGSSGGTFTFVTLTGTNSWSGTLVQDHYRLNYDTMGLDLDTDGLPAALRTSTASDGTTVSFLPVDKIPGGVPVDPTDAPDYFTCWYINVAGANDTVQRLGLKAAGSTAPAGLDGIAQLAASTVLTDETENSDGTRTLPVHALAYSGMLDIIKVRRFATFANDPAATAVTIQKNQAWTAKLTVTGSLFSGRDYRVTFGAALPAGADLTLTRVLATGNEYYYYKSTGETTILFSAFKAMGTDTALSLTFGANETAPTQETFLLSVDFSEVNATNIGIPVTVEFALKLSTSFVNLGNQLSWTALNVTNGIISATDSAVSVDTRAAGDEDLSGKRVYLIGTLSANAPYNATATLDGASGTWIAQDTIAFLLETYGNVTTGSRLFSFSGLTADTMVTWGLYAGSEITNCKNCLVSNLAESQLTADVNLPSLALVSSASHVYAQGTAATLSFSFDQLANVTSVQVTAEKQTALHTFAVLSDSAVGIIVNGTTGAAVTLPTSLGAGTYRLRFSLNETTGSVNDDVYFSFIVE